MFGNVIKGIGMARTPENTEVTVTMSSVEDFRELKESGN